MAPATAQGTLLKSTREARGLSLQVVHEATKIPMDVLRAVEEGYTVRTLSPFYFKGFIKMYAEYLRINVQDIHDDYNKRESTAVPPLPASSKPAPFFAETFDLEQWMAGVFTPRRKQQIAALAACLIAFFFLFKIITFFTHKRPGPIAQAETKKAKVSAPRRSGSAVQAAPEKKIPAEGEGSLKGTSSVKAPEAAAVLKTSPKPSADPASTSYVSPPSQQLDKEIMLTVRAKKDTWLRVAADGVTVFQSALDRGKSETWLAHDKIEISGKNMQQLEFELNGKLIGALSRRDNKAKKIMITREGLSVVP